MVQSPVISHLVGCNSLLVNPVIQASPFLTILCVLPDESFHNSVLLTSCTFSEIFMSTFPQTSLSTVYKQGHVHIHNLIDFGSCLSAYMGLQSLPKRTPSSSGNPQGSGLSIRPVCALLLTVCNRASSLTHREVFRDFCRNLICCEFYETNKQQQ